ncbi:MAG: hypothetical protein RIS35_1480 [Pseudomonadota bacterium]
MQWLSLRNGDVATPASPPDVLAGDELLWCDCLYEESRAWVAPLQRLTGIPIFDDHLRDAENVAHPSYFESTRDYEVLIFRGLAFTAPPPEAPPEGIIRRGGGSPVTPIRLRTRPTIFFLLPGCLVTIRSPENRLIPEARDRLLGTSKARQRLPASPEELMLRLLSAMVDRYLDLRQPLTDQLDRWQRQLLDPRKPFRDWPTLLDARTELRKLEQLCEEQLDAVQEWKDERQEIAAGDRRLGPLSDALVVRANDLVNHIHRVLHHARRLQDSVESAVQLHFSSTAFRTNEVMRTLTTITAIFMPLTLITGIFGMNFEFIPGLQNRLGFWVTLGAMGAIAIALLVYFSVRRYFGTGVQGLGPSRKRPGGNATSGRK